MQVPLLGFRDTKRFFFPLFFEGIHAYQLFISSCYASPKKTQIPHFWEVRPRQKTELRFCSYWWCSPQRFVTRCQGTIFTDSKDFCDNMVSQWKNRSLNWFTLFSYRHVLTVVCKEFLSDYSKEMGKSWLNGVDGKGEAIGIYRIGHMLFYFM